MVVELNPLPGILPDPLDNSCFPKAARAAGHDLRRPDPHRGRHRLAAHQRRASLLAEVRLMRAVILYDGGSDDWSAQDVAAVMTNVARGPDRPPARRS